MLPSSREDDWYQNQPDPSTARKDTEIDVEIDLVTRVISYSELFLCELAPFFNIFFIFLVARHHVMHNNLRVLMGVFSLSMTVVCLTRIPQILIFLREDSQKYDLKIIYYLHNGFFGYFIFIMIPLTFERIIATIRAKHYEKETVPYFGVAASVVVQYFHVSDHRRLV
ncbi:hypothetical protein DdX_06126 [Ditylenchus destructor]|uniref:Uncharacterized protein n=1 Tax=Ditylenchus destructor TaxID=166010 RepID=A0AAD4N717_9BILA|nr:hypothetical protein DdX_06126 [Ditylenchus destructor]